MAATEPTEADELFMFANPDCRSCEGTGWLPGAAVVPCPDCIVAVWS